MSRLRLLLLGLALAFPALAGEAGYLTREVELKAAPSQSAGAVGKLAKHTKVEVLAEQRSWAQVKAGETTGWMLSFYVMKGEPAPPVSWGRRLSSAWSFGSDRKVNTSATIGVRGLDEEDLMSAQFDELELKRLEGLSLAPSEAERFAGQGGLRPQRVDYLATPPAYAPEPASAQ
jgi:hypothetical protein